VYAQRHVHKSIGRIVGAWSTALLGAERDEGFGGVWEALVVALGTQILHRDQPT